MSKLTDPQQPNIEKQLLDAMNAAVKEQITKEFDQSIELAVKNAEHRRDEVIAKAAMSISRWYNMENLGHTIRIEVRNPDEPR